MLQQKTRYSTRKGNVLFYIYAVPPTPTAHVQAVTCQSYNPFMIPQTLKICSVLKNSKDLIAG